MSLLKTFVAAVAATLAAIPAVSHACSTCGCGDNSITLMGVEKPFAGRLRTSLDYTVSSETFGADTDRSVIDQDRTTLGVSWSPVSDATLGVQVPYVHKHITDAAGDAIDARGLGDIDLIARAVLYRDAPVAAHHLGGLRVGLKLPTSDQVHDSSGALLDIDDQPDAGTLTPSLGVWYGYYNLPVLVSFSSAYLFYGHGRQNLDPGDAVQATLSGQYMFGNFAVQLGLDSRHTDPNKVSGVEDPDTGGSVLALAPGAAYRFGTDFIVDAGAQIPLWKNLNGAQDISSGWHLNLAYDF